MLLRPYFTRASEDVFDELAADQRSSLKTDCKLIRRHEDLNVAFV
jgi:hypothetical protein